MTRDTTLDAALEKARDNYVRRNPRSQAEHIAACAAMPGGNTRSTLFFAPFPLVMARGAGGALWDADGHQYVDFLGEFSAGIYGHSHPAIRKAIDRALDGGINLSANNLVEAEFARAIRDRFSSIELLRFTNSGTEANLMAVATAISVTGRSKILVFDGGYHGGLLNFGGGTPINAPYDFIVGEYNAISDVEKLFAQHGPELAAVLIEPMMAAGGCIPAEPGFLKALRALSASNGTLLIFDEVMTSRLAPGGLQETLGITPDLTTLGKYIGGGMSFGCFGGREELMAVYDPRRSGGPSHSGTFNNNIVTMSAGLAGITIGFTAADARDLTMRGDQLRERLNAICHRHNAPLQVTGLGSIMTLHFTRDPIRSPADLKSANADLKELMFFDLLEQGVYLARRGMIALSLPLGDAEYNHLTCALENFLENRASLLAG